MCGTPAIMAHRITHVLKILFDFFQKQFEDKPNYAYPKKQTEYDSYRQTPIEFFPTRPSRPAVANRFFIIPFYRHLIFPNIFLSLLFTFGPNTNAEIVIQHNPQLSQQYKIAVTDVNSKFFYEHM